LGAGVHACRHPVEADAADEEEQPPAETLRGGQDREHEVGGRPDEQGVADRAEAGLLPQRDPRDENQERDTDDDRPEAQRDVARDTDVEDVPRDLAEGAPQHHRHRGTVEEEPDEQQGQADAEATGAQLGERADVREPTTTGRRLGSLRHASPPPTRPRVSTCRSRRAAQRWSAGSADPARWPPSSRVTRPMRAASSAMTAAAAAPEVPRTCATASIWATSRGPTKGATSAAPATSRKGAATAAAAGTVSGGATYPGTGVP